MTESFPRLFQPGTIGTLAVKNRIVMPPMLVGYGSEDGYVTERAKDYYEARAKGGVGLIIVEASMPQPAGKMFLTYLDCSDDKYGQGLAELAEVIKRHGARAAIQLGDGGREVRFDLTGRHPMGPSPVAARKREVPREMTTADIRTTVNNFAKGALRVKTAGFEGVEIHAAHVYLLSQFLSPSTNFRHDEYGGSTENRFRIMREILDESRELVGADYPIWFRMNAVEYDIEGGLKIDESKVIAQLAEQAGYDAVSISVGSPHYDSTMPSSYFPRGLFVPLAEQIKSVIDKPVIVTGRLTPAMGEEILIRRQADFIAFGRALMVDPELPLKVMEGREDEIAPCIATLNCVNRGVLRDAPITCTVNASLGREREFEIHPTANPKSVSVIGGGPAGLEAARVAALRGHRVILFEQEPELGGQLVLASRPPHKETLLELIDYFTRQLSRHGVEVRLGHEATASEVLAGPLDAVIVATGGSVSRHRRSSGRSVITTDDVLRKDVDVGQSVVIIGGDTRSCEVADLLSETGRTVTLVSGESKIAPELVGLIRGVLLKRLVDKQVSMLTRTKLGAITPTGLEAITSDGLLREIEAETVVFSQQVSLDLDLVAELRKTTPQIYCIGDCLELREHQDAIAEGSRISRLV